MGDTGSLPLGGILGLIALCIKQELLLVIIGGVFVVEALSVIIQVFSFKVFHKRVFLISPLHHHYRKSRLVRTQNRSSLFHRLRAAGRFHGCGSAHQIGTLAMDGARRTLLIVTGALLSIGMVMVYSASFVMSEKSKGTPTYYLEHHAIYLVLGCIALAVSSVYDYHRLARHWKWFIAAALLLLIAVFVPGTQAPA